MTEHTKLHIDIALIKRLVATQFPKWADLSIKPVKNSGWDNKTFHLGNQMIVRMPSHADYAGQVLKEQYWLPKLAPLLPISIPKPLAMGLPDKEFPFSWSIYEWIDGDTATHNRISNLCQFAVDLGYFLQALEQCGISGGQLAGKHNFHRGGELRIYDNETREAIKNIDDTYYAKTLSEIWELALASKWEREPVWIHGDIAVGNLLVNNGKLSAVIDFGLLAIGDPACDLVIAWTFFTDKSRTCFRDAIKLDKATWARARGWGLWKALCWAFPGEKRIDWRVIDEIIADHFRENK